MSGDAIPRFGEVAAKLAENGYAPLPLCFGDKKPCAGESWSHYKFVEQDLRRATWRTAGTGILCGKVVAIDIDVRDQALAAKLEAVCEEMLGAAPRRGLGSLDQYRRSGEIARDRGQWLAAFDGGPRTVERVNRGAMFVPN
jgi:hypothetical protein